MKNDPIERALAQLDEVRAGSPESHKQLAKALEAKSNLVAAKAARIVGSAQITELTEALATAFTRLLRAGTAADKGCAAKLAIARALNELELNDADLFLSGMHHRQPEPVWGGSVDTAAELRSVCALGLAGSTCHFRMREFVDLLADPEWLARAGAVRAIAAIGSETSALLLRLKVWNGDPEVEVMSECFAGLLTINGAEALPLVMKFAGAKPERRSDGLREAAILAMGASRRADAVGQLIALADRTTDQEGIGCVSVALATSRNETAIEFLLKMVKEGSSTARHAAVSAIESQSDPRLLDLLDRAKS
jgi:hypothetical protein